MVETGFGRRAQPLKLFARRGRDRTPSQHLSWWELSPSMPGGEVGSEASADANALLSQNVTILGSHRQTDEAGQGMRSRVVKVERSPNALSRRLWYKFYLLARPYA